MENDIPNENGVLMHPEIIESFNDGIVSFKIKKSKYKDEYYFASEVLVNGCGIYSGSSGPVSIYTKSSYNNEIECLKTFIKRELNNTDKGIAHLNKMKLFQIQTEQQLTLFD